MEQAPFLYLGESQCALGGCRDGAGREPGDSSAADLLERRAAVGEVDESKMSRSHGGYCGQIARMSTERLAPTRRSPFRTAFRALRREASCAARRAI